MPQWRCRDLRVITRDGSCQNHRVPWMFITQGSTIDANSPLQRSYAMNVIRRRGWELPERVATPEHLFVDRRSFLAATAAVLATPSIAAAQRVADLPDPSVGLYPAKRNDKYVLDRPVTDEAINTTYNNFYEFGSAKTISRAAQALKLRPWVVKIDGMVEKPFEIGIDDLLAKVSLEERLYRHRCVEAWSMAIPWAGFPLAKLV